MRASEHLPFGAPAIASTRPRGALERNVNYWRFEAWGRCAYVRKQSLAEMVANGRRAARRSQAEAAFLCLGRRAEDDMGGYTIVEELPWLAVGQGLSVQVSPRDKDGAMARHPALDVVGWAHTHPNLGAFFSAADVIVCDDFGPDALNLVLDPLRGELGIAWGSRLFAVHTISGSGRRTRVGRVVRTDRPEQPRRGFFSYLRRRAWI